MKKILIVSPWFPYPLNSGGNQAICNGINALAEDFEIHVLYVDYACNLHKNQQSLLKETLNCTKLYGFWNYKILIEEAKRRFLGKRFDYKYLDLLSFHGYPRTLRKKINDIIQKEKIDCVQMEMFDALPLVDYLPHNVKKIFVHHEIRYVLGGQLRALCKNKNRFLAKLKIEQEKEISYLNKFDTVITLSKADKERLIADGVTCLCQDSLAVVSRNSQCCLEDVSCEKRLVFIGPEQHLPNKNGLAWFLDNCWEKLDEQYALDIVGCWSDSTKIKWSKNYRNISFKGYVDDLKASLKGAVMIVPIFEGSGIRMKILEAAQMGVPFVSTSIGNMGLCFENNLHCCIADSVDGFVAAIRKLESPDERKKIANNAFDIVQKNYSIENLRKSRFEIISALC